MSQPVPLWKVCVGPRDSKEYEVIQNRLTLPEARDLRDETKKTTRAEKVVWIAIDPVTSA